MPRPSLRRPDTGELLILVAAVVLTVPVSIGLIVGATTWLIAIASALMTGLVACVLLRQRAPVWAFRGSCLAMVGLVALPDLPEGVSYAYLPVALLHLLPLYSVVSLTGARAEPLLTSAAGIALLVARTAVAPPEQLDLGALLVFVAAAVGLLGGTIAYGAYVWAQRQLEAQQAHLGIRRERELVAREVHDVVAHSLAVVVTQLDAALLVFDRDPARARSMVDTSLTSARGAMDEMRHVVGVLRDDTPVAAPVESLADLRTLLERLRVEGTDLSLATDGDLAAVGGEVARAVYRIVQESVTNSVKHASGAVRCHVEVAVRPDRVAFSIRDDGPGHDPARPSAGYGVAGMRERARALDGKLSISSSTKGTQVSGWIPLP